MREILFRGKRIDNEEWVYGALVDGEKYCLIGQMIKFSPYVENECKIVGYKVDRNTICQYTGFDDKNGVKIFENDILECQYDDNFPSDKVRYMVTFKNGGWALGKEDKLEHFDCVRGVVVGSMFDEIDVSHDGAVKKKHKSLKVKNRVYKTEKGMVK